MSELTIEHANTSRQIAAFCRCLKFNHLSVDSTTTKVSKKLSFVARLATKMFFFVVADFACKPQNTELGPVMNAV